VRKPGYAALREDYCSGVHTVMADMVSNGRVLSWLRDQEKGLYGLKQSSPVTPSPQPLENLSRNISLMLLLKPIEGGKENGRAENTTEVVKDPKRTRM